MINDVIKTHVWEALDNARENGYLLHDMRYWSVDMIAADLADYESSLEGLDPDILIPYIESWMEKNYGV